MIARGSVCWADLGFPVGSAPGFRRPVVVVQSDLFNATRIPTTIVATMTTNLDLAQAPGNVLVPASSSGLGKDSVVNVSQVLTVDRSQLEPPVGGLPIRLMSAIDEGLRDVLDL